MEINKGNRGDPLGSPLRVLEEQNARAVERSKVFRKQRAEGSVAEIEYHKLKHAFPYRGFVECWAGSLSFVMFSCNDDVVAWTYFWLGNDGYEQALVERWIAWVGGASTVLDIGAYTGLMSIIAAIANPNCSVHAIEPMERTAERMKINIRSNGVEERVTVHTRAAGAEFGLEMINLYRDKEFLGTGNSLNAKGKKVSARQLVQVVNLDQYLGTKHRFDVIKIDVEGFENQVLRGLQRIIRRDRPRIILELWKENEGEVFRMLDVWGYDMQAVESTPARVMNYFCEPRGRTDVFGR